jgi:hypothetical protein
MHFHQSLLTVLGKLWRKVAADEGYAKSSGAAAPLRNPPGSAGGMGLNSLLVEPGLGAHV